MQHNEDGYSCSCQGRTASPQRAWLYISRAPEGQTPETLLVFIHFERKKHHPNLPVSDLDQVCICLRRKHCDYWTWGRKFELCGPRYPARPMRVYSQLHITKFLLFATRLLTTYAPFFFSFNVDDLVVWCCV